MDGRQGVVAVAAVIGVGAADDDVVAGAAMDLVGAVAAVDAVVAAIAQQLVLAVIADDDVEEVAADALLDIVLGRVGVVAVEDGDVVGVAVDAGEAALAQVKMVLLVEPEKSTVSCPPVSWMTKPMSWVAPVAVSV